jgi:hypothetical protein
MIIFIVASIAATLSIMQLDVIHAYIYSTKDMKIKRIGNYHYMQEQ